MTRCVCRIAIALAALNISTFVGLDYVRAQSLNDGPRDAYPGVQIQPLTSTRDLFNSSSFPIPITAKSNSAPQGSRSNSAHEIPINGEFPNSLFERSSNAVAQPAESVQPNVRQPQHAQQIPLQGNIPGPLLLSGPSKSPNHSRNTDPQSEIARNSIANKPDELFSNVQPNRITESGTSDFVPRQNSFLPVSGELPSNLLGSGAQLIAQQHGQLKQQFSEPAAPPAILISAKPSTGNSDTSNPDSVAAPGPGTKTENSNQQQDIVQPPNDVPPPIQEQPPIQVQSRGEVQPPGETVGPTNFQLAAQPSLGANHFHQSPKTDARAHIVPHSQYDFSQDPVDPSMPYDAWSQIDVYQGKRLYANQRPLLEIGRPWYQLGELSPGKMWFGATNLSSPQLIVFGDVRSAVANIRQNGNDQTIWAFQANIDIDLKLTATERFHMFMGPLDRGGNNTRFVYDNGTSFISEFDPDIDFGYFEGDLGAIVGGCTGQTLPFDFPFAVGVIPLVFQNGVWMEDAVLGAAFTIPARNSAALDISNMDTTFFAGFDKIDSPAFEGDDNAGKMYGAASFIEALNGYFELDYAYLEDREFRDRSYHNVGIGYTRRFGKVLSNSVRVITNAGQSTEFGPNTADGFVFLVENSLITENPSTFVPYANFWVGVDRPQSAARAGVAGGILRNTGILFESDNMTGFPTLDPSANDTWGGAIGMNIFKQDFSQQLVLEAAMVEVLGNDPNRNAAGRQLGLGARYQLPLNNAVIFRADAMLGFLENADNLSGVRVELRHKF
jgi:hypothetical protein